jgi:hypothetical protein
VTQNEASGLTGAAHKPASKYSFCERVTATPTSPEHIRVVGEEGLKLGGGAPDTVLCGASLSKGWDLNNAVDAETVRRLSTPRDADGHVFLCLRCAEADNELTAGQNRQ